MDTKYDIKSQFDKAATFWKLIVSLAFGKLYI